MQTIQSANLACREGGKDAVYHLQLVKVEAGHLVNFQYGRRGSSLTSGTKTKEPVSFELAEKTFNKIMKEKMTASPAYRSTDSADSANQAPSMSQVSAEMAARSTGLTPQLLNSIDEFDLLLMLRDPAFVVQQKFDGERRMVKATGGAIK